MQFSRCLYCTFVPPPPPPQGDSEEARALAKAIGEKMDQLERLLQLELTRKVAEDFKDPLGPLQALTKAALAPPGKGLLVHGS